MKELMLEAEEGFWRGLLEQGLIQVSGRKMAVGMELTDW